MANDTIVFDWVASAVCKPRCVQALKDFRVAQHAQAQQAKDKEQQRRAKEKKLGY
jgi:hypothetical protein